MADTVCVPYSGNGNNTTLFGMDFTNSVNEENISTGKLQGYYVEPKEPGTYPGIVMIHEWWGLNDNIKYMARLLANSGYRVFAIDLYGEVATTPERARELATSVRNNPNEANAKMTLATEYLRDTKSATKLGTLGWCFGGQQSLNVSLETPLDATVIYYGNLTEDTTKSASLAGPVLAIFGDKDTSIPLDKIQLFQKNLETLGKENTFYIYPGLGHAFANPSGANYASGQTVDAWNKTLDFLEKNLK
jgi:carboxymethylenebutenolidase